MKKREPGGLAGLVQGPKAEWGQSRSGKPEALP